MQENQDVREINETDTVTLLHLCWYLMLTLSKLFGQLPTHGQRSWR